MQAGAQVIVTISLNESYWAELIEVCKPRSKHDWETCRVQLPSGRVIRVAASQIKPR